MKIILKNSINVRLNNSVFFDLKIIKAKTKAIIAITPPSKIIELYSIFIYIIYKIVKSNRE